MPISNRVKIYIVIAILLVAAAVIYVERTEVISLPGNINNALLKTEINSSNYGKAPDFADGYTWLNSDPLKLSDLKGKVVLVDFWTYSCINCIRTLPYVTKWYDTYKDDGFVVIGVHTPEFSFEKDTNNVKNAINQFGIRYPVVQDNDYVIWNSYQNRYWPAEYLIDKNGQIVRKHFGEGEYEQTENAIRYLLGLDMAQENVAGNNLSGIGSPEMYFGTDRLQNLSSEQQLSANQKDYTLNNNISLNRFSLGGNWSFTGKYAELTGSEGQINLKFHSAKLYIVALSQEPAVLKITVDGEVQSDITVKDSKLYTLFDSNDYSDHTVLIEISQPGFEAFTFTFG